MQNVTMRPMGHGHEARLTASPNLRDFIANAFTHCWLGTDENNPNEDCNFRRPVTTDDVTELRGLLLDTLETLIVGLWKGDFKPNDGDLDMDSQSLGIGDYSDENPDGSESIFQWFVRLDHDVIMIELGQSDGDDTALWLDYDALNDRQAVVKTLQEARQYTFEKNVWDKLIAEAD